MHVNAPGDVSLILKEYQRVLSKKGVLFIRVFNKTVNDSDLPIFFVDSPNNSLPVYGYSKEKFASIASRYFHVEKKISMTLAMECREKAVIIFTVNTFEGDLKYTRVVHNPELIKMEHNERY